MKVPVKLRRVRLQNVKSYIDQEIVFNEGVNFISGINGAGKSSIIEAVGYALFEHNPGTISEFLRYGTKTGTITVEFCAIDEREYRVVRKLGTSNLWTVFDLETGGELDLHGAKDVKTWLKDALGVDQDMDLDQLFRDIVGVPQGTFVAPFLETPSLRKKKFDTILKVEQYREAYFNTRGAVKTLDEQIRRFDKELAVKEAGVKEFDTVTEQVHNLESQVRTGEARQVELAAQLKATATTVTDLDKLKESLDRTEIEIQTLIIQIEGLQSREKDLQVNLARAEKCNTILAAARPGYEAYLSLQQQVKELEKTRAEKEALEQKYNKLAQEAVSLETAIDAKTKEIEVRAAEIETEQTRLLKHNDEIKAEKVSLRLKHKELLTTQDDLNRWSQVETKFEQIKRIIQEAQREIVGKRQMILETLDKEAGEIGERLQVMPQIAAQAQMLEAREKELNEAREAWARLKERLQALERDSEKAADGLCPFLQSPCQNVAGDLKGFFAQQMKEVGRQLQELKDLGVRLAKETEAAKAAREKLIALAGDRKRLEQIQQQKVFLEQEVRQLMENIRQQDMLGIAQELAGQIKKMREDLPEELSAQIENLLRIWTTPESGEDAIEPVLVSSECILEHSKNLWAVINKKVQEAVNAVSNELTRCTTEETSNNKMIGQAQVKAKQLAEERTGLAQKQKRQQEIQQVREQLTVQLDLYKDVDGKLKDTKVSLEKHLKDYETYMQNVAEARKRDSLEKEISGLQAGINEKSGSLEAAKVKKAELAGAYDPQKHQTEKTRQDQLRQDVAAGQEIIKAYRKELQVQKEKLEVMNKTLAEIAELRQQLEGTMKTLTLLETVRNILNNAGGPVARVYLEHLSREANEVYRQISSENAVLHWRPDYDIALTDNFQGRERVRTFKQFSGGEQMTAALAVRLALLKQQSLVKVGFFDEPTANLDSDRRMNLAETIPRVTGEFDQLFIISHDDTFDSITDNIIHLQKGTENGSTVE